MSAAQLAPFTLTPPHDQSRCGFPGCLGKAFHEGEHEFATAQIPHPASGSPQHGWMTHSWLNSTEHRQTEAARAEATKNFLAARDRANTPRFLPSGAREYFCTICKRAVVEYGEYVSGSADLCDSQQCLDAWCILTATEAPLMCCCLQRPYPHELSVHTKLRGESYNPEFKKRWPWSLMLSSRVEMSTEREAA